MKKLLAVALMICLLLPCAIAEAPVDVKSLSDAELKALYKEVKVELMERKLLDEAKLPAGVYQAGKGLPEGIYVCTALSQGMIIIYQDYNQYSRGYDFSRIYLDKGESFTMQLFGDVVYLFEFETTISPFSGPEF